MGAHLERLLDQNARGAINRWQALGEAAGRHPEYRPEAGRELFLRRENSGEEWTRAVRGQ